MGCRKGSAFSFPQRPGAKACPALRRSTPPAAGRRFRPGATCQRIHVARSRSAKSLAAWVPEKHRRINLPEAGRHAPILIATSWQALNRARHHGPDTRFCDCTVVILFAGFYVEASLNSIIQELRMTGQMKFFLKRPHPGLQDKLAWFYNEFVARSKAASRDELYNGGITAKVRRRFPWICEVVPVSKRHFARRDQPQRAFAHRNGTTSPGSQRHG